MQANWMRAGVLAVIAGMLCGGCCGLTAQSKKRPALTDLKQAGSTSSGYTIVADLEDLCVSENDKAAFSFVVEPNQGLVYEWFINGKAQKRNSRQYQFGKAQESDVAIYRCRAYDRSGRLVAESSMASLFFLQFKSTTLSIVATATGPLITTGSTVGNCPGTYYSYVKFKTPTGSYWFPQPAETKTCTLTDKSLYLQPYASKIYALPSVSLTPVCGPTPLSISTLESAAKYQFTVYNVGDRDLPAGSPIKLEILWGY